MENAISIINMLYDEGFNIIFCTYPQYNSIYCIGEKIQWLQKYFKWFNVDVHVVFTGNKAILAQSNIILLDDSIKNIDAFINNKGIGCVCTKGWNKDYNSKYRVSNFHEFYNLVHDLNINFSE